MLECGTYVLGGLLGSAGSYVGVRHCKRSVSFCNCVDDVLVREHLLFVYGWKNCGMGFVERLIRMVVCRRDGLVGELSTKGGGWWADQWLHVMQVVWSRQELHVLVQTGLDQACFNVGQRCPVSVDASVPMYDVPHELQQWHH